MEQRFPGHSVRMSEANFERRPTTSETRGSRASLLTSRRNKKHGNLSEKSRSRNVNKTTSRSCPREETEPSAGERRKVVEGGKLWERQVADWRLRESAVRGNEKKSRSASPCSGKKNRRTSVEGDFQEIHRSVSFRLKTHRGSKTAGRVVAIPEKRLAEARRAEIWPISLSIFLNLRWVFQFCHGDSDGFMIGSSKSRLTYRFLRYRITANRLASIVSQNVQNVKCNKNYCRSNRQINAKGREIWPTSNGMRDSKVTLLDRSSGSRLVGRHIHEKPPLDTTEFIRHDVIALPGPTT